MDILSEQELVEILAPKGGKLITPDEMINFFKIERKISFKKLSKALGLSRQQIYAWVKNGSIPDNRQRDLIELKSRILLWESKNNCRWGN